MITASDIPEHLDVVASDGQHVGRVDHVRGTRIELARLDRTTMGRRFTIPLSWVDHVDDKVHLNVGSAEATTGWARDEDD